MNSPFVIDTSLVKSLIIDQFPEWTDLEIKPVMQQGWDNRTFHLGSNMLVRLPSAACYSDKVKKEQQWLPYLATHLPYTIPTPIAMGSATSYYPWSWSIYKWIEGEAVSYNNIVSLNQFAAELGNFLVALQEVDATEGPRAGEHNFYRGGSLKIHDAQVEQALIILQASMDIHLIKALWEKALESEWKKPGLWVHGDVAPGNILVRNRKITALIDFGGLAVGDPACDYAIAWTFFDHESRKVFCTIGKVDDNLWARARGWALWKALIIYAGLPGADIKQKKCF